MSKPSVLEIELVEGFGVRGDAHFGKTVQHRSRLNIRPVPFNLRQVHLIHFELLQELKSKGFEILPGMMGENVSTEGIDLLALPRNTKLSLGDEAILQVTGLRNPCNQLNLLAPGLMNAVLDRTDSGELIRKAGIMAVVLKGGIVKSGDEIGLELPNKPHFNLERV